MKFFRLPEGCTDLFSLILPLAYPVLYFVLCPVARSGQKQLLVQKKFMIEFADKDSKSLVVAALALGLLASACSRERTHEQAKSESAAVAESVAAVAEEQYAADNDIGMTVRSVANTINIGEKLDSTDYNFEGVLTDGVGMPLFTDFTGMPGQWEIEVVDSATLRIRNVDAGDLQPFRLMEYITANLSEQAQELELTGESDQGRAHIVNYRYGRTCISMETRPMAIENSADVAPVMEITLRASTDSLPEVK